MKELKTLVTLQCLEETLPPLPRILVRVHRWVLSLFVWNPPFFFPQTASLQGFCFISAILFFFFFFLLLLLEIKNEQSDAIPLFRELLI